MVRTKALLVDSQGAPVKRFGFLQTIDGLKQLGQVVKVARNSRMVRTEYFLINNQSAPIKWFGFFRTIGGLEQLCYIVEVGGHPWMVRTEALLIDCQRPSVHLLRIPHSAA